MSCSPTKILVVDDSALYRQSIQNVLRDIPQTSVIGSARDGLEALEKIERLAPDLVTLDVQMPDMDGIQVLRELKKRHLNTSVIMVSSLTADGAQVTTDALMEGAFDFILKPSGGDALANRQLLRDSLASKIETFQASEAACHRNSILPRADNASRMTDDESLQGSRAVPSPASACRLVVIGTSTGGPEALRTVLPKIAEQMPIPILVVQHMPAKYTTTLANRLDSICPLNVTEAVDQMPLEAGRILLAPGGKQMRLEKNNAKFTVRITEDAAENGVRPSVDYLLRSAIELLRSQVLAVIMTGMGRDGLEGCRGLKQAGGYVFAQNQADCVVYGMPKAVIEAGLADRVLSMGKIAPAIFRHVKRSQREASEGKQ